MASSPPPSVDPSHLSSRPNTVSLSGNTPNSTNSGSSTPSSSSASRRCNPYAKSRLGDATDDSPLPSRPLRQSSGGVSRGKWQAPRPNKSTVDSNSQRQHQGRTGAKQPNDPCHEGQPPPCFTCLAMLQHSERLGKLSFGCPLLDAALGGGVPLRGLTEIAGEAGTGKTQLCLQLLLRAVLPREKGGLGGRAVALSCGEGPFPSKRLSQMAHAAAAAAQEPVEHVNAQLDLVSIQTVRNADEQFQVITEQLPAAMARLGARLVVIDSVSGLLRTDMGGGHGAAARAHISARTRMLFKMAQVMKELSDRHDAAFVLVNQVTGRPGIGGNSGGSVPAMGLGWSNCVNTRYVLHRRQGGVSADVDARGSSAVDRELVVELSPSLPSVRTRYRICTEGVRGAA